MTEAIQILSNITVILSETEALAKQNSPNLMIVKME
jgi:hypothetical protein